MPDLAPSEKSIFLQAIEAASGADRAAYLDQACQGNPPLRAEVDALLRAHEAPQRVLDTPVAGTPTTDQMPPSEMPGTMIGPYKLLQQVGEGGMGVVYMAEQEAPVRRKVALKIIRPGTDSSQVIARFEAERQALALMDHQNIARVLDAGTTDSGRPYFVMELVKGVPFTRFCDEQHLTPRGRLELFVPVCQAIQHAHQKGIIHRDIKSSNVLVTLQDGRPVPKVIDFGVAKATEQRLTERTLFTQLGQVVGTLEYMSPEQAELNALDIDTRSDIYSLGVMLYELLTGSTPLEKQKLRGAAFSEMLRMIREEEPPRPSTRLSATAELPSVAANRGLEPKQLRGVVRGELDWIVMKALEKDRDRRYETANGLAKDVQRYLADEPVLACPPSAWYRFRKFARRNTALLTAATVVAATLLVAGATVTWKWWQAECARDEAQDAGTRARQGEERAVAAERESRLREAWALVGQARGTRLSRRPGQRFDALTALRKALAIGRELRQPPAWFDALRNEAIAALALPDLPITQEFGRPTPGKGWVELSDDFELYVQTSEQGDCTLRRVADDAEVVRWQGRGEFAYAGFVPGRPGTMWDSSAYVFRLLDIRWGKPVCRFEEKNVISWAFDPRGRFLVLQHGDAALSVYEVATGRAAHRFALGGAYHRGWRFHPTEPLIAGFSYSSHVVEVYDLQTGAVVASATPTWPHGNGGGDWSPDGRTLLVPEADGIRIQEYAFDASPPALRPLRTLVAPYQGDATLIFNPTGKCFVTRGWSGTVHLFDAGSGQLLLKTPSRLYWANEMGLQFDRTGQRLASTRVGDADERIGVWSFAAGLEYRSLVVTGKAEHRFGPAVHPGSRLAALGRADGVALFDLEAGREVAHVSLRGNHTAACFDGAGNLLTNGTNGFLRWPVRGDPANPGRLRVGPPERLPFNEGEYPIAASRDGRVIAQSMFGAYGMGAYAGGWILHPNSPTPRRVDAGLAMEPTSVSPDGRWVAFGWHEGRVHVYDAATGQRVWQSPPCATTGNCCCFSPDGRWLLTHADGSRSYAVGTWAPGPRLGPGAPWDATPELAVVGQTNGVYRLVELATGRELARLEDQEQSTGRAAFSPDGAWVVIEAEYGLRVWDLRRLRAGLVDLGLDWDAPPLPKSPDAGRVSPLEVTIDRVGLDAWSEAERVADGLRRQGDLAGALAAIQKAHALSPDNDAWHNNYLAYLLALCPDPKLRDAPRAVELGKKSVEVAPDTWGMWRTLGITHHFAGDDEAAVQALTQSLKLRQGGEAFDYFPLAAAHQKLGHQKEARQWYDRGVAWMAEHAHPYAAELAVLRADAEVILGIEAPSKPAPDRPPDRKE
jgi:serine/threonine protein kinase/WD40 repeat protein